MNMNPEEIPNKIEKEVVLEMLKMNGFGHPETRELVTEWTKQKETEVEKNENPNRASILFNIERTDLYFVIGDTRGAVECLEDALLQAEKENEVELQEQILEKLKGLK